MAAALLVVLALMFFGHGDWAMLAFVPFALALAVIGRRGGRPMVWPLVGLFWLGLPCLAILWLRMGDHMGNYMGDHGLLAVACLFISVWSCDTGAYFAGRSIGGPRLAPRISPKKTWSGLLGGMVAAAIASALLALVVGQGSAVSFAVLGASLALISQLGDLAESSVKRRFDVKDSGSIIPGHGGILDRVDGVLFAAPVMALLILLGQVLNLRLMPWQ
jgi:phosphatidate cytidylyltransferase